jgi:hypothetical protein
MNAIARKLHIGAFDQVLPGWINADITPHIFVTRVPGLTVLLHRAAVIAELRYRQHKEGTFNGVRCSDEELESSRENGLACR